MLYSVWIPYEVIHLHRISLLVRVFPAVSERQRDPDTFFRRSIFCGLLWSNLLLFKFLNQLVTSHVHEDLLASLILSLDDEAFSRLDDCSALGVNDGVALAICVLLLEGLALRDLSLHDLLVHGHNLLVGVPLEAWWHLGIGVIRHERSVLFLIDQEGVFSWLWYVTCLSSLHCCC